MEKENQNSQEDVKTIKAKERLLKVALNNFAEYGYEGASIRDITKQAHVNISAISYYFKDKEGLYQASIDLLSKKIQTELMIYVLKANETFEKNDLSLEEQKEIIYDFWRRFIRFFLTESSYSKLLLREQIETSPSFEKFYKTTLNPLRLNLGKLLAKVNKMPFPSEQATLCANTIGGMLTMFSNYPKTVLLRLGWEKFGDEEIEKITEMFIHHLDCIIDSYNKPEK